MAKKPNEPHYRFIGGFVDRTDESWEQAAKREFKEETGGNAEIDDIRYVCSAAVKDWRYNKTESGIMTTLLLVSSYGDVLNHLMILHHCIGLIHLMLILTKLCQNTKSYLKR